MEWSWWLVGTNGWGGVAVAWRTRVSAMPVMPGLIPRPLRSSIPLSTSNSRSTVTSMNVNFRSQLHYMYIYMTGI
ncbi:hypothetical protein EDD16DRAFT_1628594 [Pisolithus croceorrhizus]|nr:hypothetical protein EDD16DRAFT_1628594 [Pisolithus croceorrhizus]KAI6116706.1 hypothetical protein EV401DRAFT_1973443 [Pisolithus croceorrhizus]